MRLEVAKTTFLSTWTVCHTTALPPPTATEAVLESSKVTVLYVSIRQAQLMLLSHIDRTITTEQNEFVAESYA